MSEVLKEGNYRPFCFADFVGKSLRCQNIKCGCEFKLTREDSDKVLKSAGASSYAVAKLADFDENAGDRVHYDVPCPMCKFYVLFHWRGLDFNGKEYDLQESQ